MIDDEREDDTDVVVVLTPPAAGVTEGMEPCEYIMPVVVIDDIIVLVR
jgi:hypothetical protein